MIDPSALLSGPRIEGPLHEIPAPWQGALRCLFAARILASTTPTAAQAAAQETCWIYRSNVPVGYAGGNDYFMPGHDLREDGHLIDVANGPVYAVAGEYDPTLAFPDHGAAALPRRVPGAEFRQLKGLGHFAPTSHPVGFCEAITPLLDELMAKAAQAAHHKGNDHDH